MREFTSSIMLLFYLTAFFGASFAAGARRVGTDHQYENQCKEQRQPDQVFDGADQVCFHRFTDVFIGAKIM